MNSLLKQIVLIVLVGSVVLVLAEAVMALPTHSPGLQPVVAEAMPRSGVTNPITGVLLNFRGYDTLLEVVVLLMALWAVLGVGGTHLKPIADTDRNPLFQALIGCLVPSLVLVAGYLLWIGGSKPGGAFQAAAMLTAAGVLLHLAGHRPLRYLGAFGEKLATVGGPLVFILVALLGVRGGALLTYPEGQAKGWILVIEAACTLAIAVILLALFVGGRLEARD